MQKEGHGKYCPAEKKHPFLGQLPHSPVPSIIREAPSPVAGQAEQTKAMTLESRELESSPNLAVCPQVVCLFPLGFFSLLYKIKRLI